MNNVYAINNIDMEASNTNTVINYYGCLINKYNPTYFLMKFCKESFTLAKSVYGYGWVYCRWEFFFNFLCEYGQKVVYICYIQVLVRKLWSYLTRLFIDYC